MMPDPRSPYFPDIRLLNPPAAASIGSTLRRMRGHRKENAAAASLRRVVFLLNARALEVSFGAI